VTESALTAGPANASAVSLKADEASDVDAWGTLGGAVANLHVSEGGAGGYGSLFELRGLSNTPYFSDPSVTVYFGDIPLPSSFTYQGGLFGFGSASVLAGPQGTRFGRATDGGVILFEPGEPEAAAGGELLAGYGSYDSRQSSVEAHTAGTGPVDAEIFADYDARNGYVQNREIGVRVDDQEDESAFARVRYRPSAGDELTLELLRTRERDGAEPLVPLGGPLYTVSRPAEGSTDLDSTGAALRGSFALPGGASLTTVTSYTDWSMNPYADLLVIPPSLENVVLQDQKSWSEEVHLLSDERSEVHGEVGLWLSGGSTDSFVDRSLPGLFPIDVSGFSQSNRSAAVFGQASYQPVAAWTFTAGLRAEDDSKDFTRKEEVPIPGLDYVASARYGGLLPRLAANLRLSAQSSLEASVAVGMRPGGFASFTDNPALIPFAAEHTVAYALSWQAFLVPKTLSLSLRPFYDSISNLQIERSFTATDYFVATAPKAHSEGAELELLWLPSAHWRLSLNAGFDQTRLDTFTSPTSGQDESGNPAPGIPSYTAGMETSYRSAGGWFAAGRLTAVGVTHYDELSSTPYTQGAYALLGLRAGFETPRWILTVYGENLGKAGYYELIVPGVQSGAPGAPRTVGAKVAVKF